MESIVAAVITAFAGFGAGWLAAIRGAKIGADLTLRNERELEKDRRQQTERDLRSALVAELHLNRSTLELAGTSGPPGPARTTAWDAVVGLTFTEREWKALVDAERRLAGYNVAATLAQVEGPTAGAYGMWTIAAKTRAKEAITYVAFAITILEGKG